MQFIILQCWFDVGYPLHTHLYIHTHTHSYLVSNFIESWHYRVNFLFYLIRDTLSFTSDLMQLVPSVLQMLQLICSLFFVRTFKDYRKATFFSSFFPQTMKQYFHSWFHISGSFYILLCYYCITVLFVLSFFCMFVNCFSIPSFSSFFGTFLQQQQQTLRWKTPFQ